LLPQDAAQSRGMPRARRSNTHQLAGKKRKKKNNINKSKQNLKKLDLFLSKSRKTTSFNVRTMTVARLNEQEA